jgi:hypothetical protein
MKLTIIPSDGAVYENNLCYSNLTWEGTPENVSALQWLDTAGWIEFKTNLDGTKPENETITVLPQWADNAMAAWTVANTPVPPTPPTPEQIQATNKSTAVSLLQQTDWTTIPDVSDPAKSNPYLTNANEFIAFRNQVRPVAINPPTTLVTFPTIPTDQWATL